MRPRRWNVAKLDEAKYATAAERGVAELDRLRGAAGPVDAEELTADGMGVIEKACGLNATQRTETRQKTGILVDARDSKSPEGVLQAKTEAPKSQNSKRQRLPICRLQSSEKKAEAYHPP